MAIVPYEIPLSPTAAQFDISLANVDYNMRITWNPVANCWILDISDTDNVPLVQGIPLITGADLLAQYTYLGIAGGLVVTTDTGIGVPTYEGLGVSGHLYFVVPDNTATSASAAGTVYGISGGKFTTLPVSGGSA